ncbi:olfactory receptor 10AG1-like [Petaurus breviceps papuanus]|uniref:olfactory receptor 10AG1-like n=1 Tax=Petaurus breviceps papuanus TaxID=3040969 RepID=UPI0036DC05AB
MEHTERMTTANFTNVIGFILLGFSDDPNLQGFLFGIFLIIYLSILVGNGLIIVITKTDSALQTPMYFFLGNFSFLEICYTSVTLPKMLMDLYTKNRYISFLECAVQLGFFLIFGLTECFLLTVMAYDRYVTICKPLYYSLIMNHNMCVCLVIASCIGSIPGQIGQTCQIFSLPFCGSNKLNHAFCDITPLLEVACGDISMNEYAIYAGVVLFGMAPFLLILTSYVRIITSILKLQSAKGRHKAFSTCSSHLITVSLFFGSGIIMYLRPKSTHFAGTDKVLSLFYNMVTPMFNPLIYSLRNRDVIVAMKKFLPV